MHKSAMKWSRIQRSVVGGAGLLAIVAACPALATPPTPDQICQFKKLKANAVLAKKAAVCLARYFKVPAFDPTNCLNAALGVFDGAIATIEAAGGCRIENQHDALLNDVSGALSFLDVDVQPIYRRVFVTSTTYQGDIGGVPVADYLCRTRAQAANQGFFSQWKAWVSDSTTSPDAKFSRPATIPYVLMDGTTVVANNWADLTDGSLQNLIDQDEFGNPVSAPFTVWTGTTPSGTADSPNCMDWTSNSPGDLGTRGADVFAVGGDWTALETSSCDSLNRLYCVEQ